MRSGLCEKRSKKRAEKGEEVGLHLEGEKSFQRETGTKYEWILTSTSILPPSLVNKVQEGFSCEIAFRCWR